MTQRTTRTDSGALLWRIDDPIIRLRVWGTETVYHLPAPPVNDWIIGTGDGSSLRLTDSDGLISRRHCKLAFEQAQWTIRDLGSKNGTFVDGSQREACVIAPGAEIRLGKITFLAESAALADLRAYLSRILGWKADRFEAVDHALRAVRLAATRRAALVLCGDGDLVAIAHDLHRRVIGPDKPFVSCDPRRREVSANVRSAMNFAKGMQALSAAKGGSLCVWTNRLPRDFNEVTAALRHPSAEAQLTVCAHTPAEARSFIAAPIVIPSLRTRDSELARVIDEYAMDALASLGCSGPFTHDDRAWVREHSASSLPEIEKGTRRLVALRHTKTLSAAAALLGMAQGSLQEWVDRRTLPSLRATR